MKPDHERVSKLLLDTVTLLCKNGLTYDTELKIQGLLAITLDTSEVFVVHINESFGGGTGCTTLTQNDRDCVALSSDAERPPPRKRHAPAREEIVDLTRMAETPDVRPTRHAVPPSSTHSDSQRRQRIGAQVPSQQHSQNQTMPSPISSLADVAARMLPPQGVPSAVPRHDGNLYPLSSAPPARTSVMNMAVSERFPNVNNQTLRQRCPNYSQANPSLREEEAAANQRQVQRLTMENKRLAAARMAAAQQRHASQLSAQGSAHQSSSYGIAGGMPAAPGNYAAMSLHHRNPAPVPPLHQASIGSGSSLPYQYPYPVNHLYEEQSRMLQPMSHVNAVPNLPMLSERPRFAESSNPVQQLMLNYERLGQQYQNSSRAPTMSASSSFHMSTLSGSSYSPSHAQKEHQSRSLPGASSEHTHMNLEHNSRSDLQAIAKEYMTSSSISTTSQTRKNPRVPVQHIDLSNDIDDDLQQTLQSELLCAESMPASSIVIQPDDVNAALDAASNGVSEFVLSNSQLLAANEAQVACGQQSGERSTANPECIMGDIQEIAPLVVLNELNELTLPNDAMTDSHLQSPDGRALAVLSDSGRSTGSERMDCNEESLAAQLDGCFDEITVDPQHPPTLQLLSENVSDMQVSDCAMLANLSCRQLTLG